MRRAHWRRLFFDFVEPLIVGDAKVVGGLCGATVALGARDRFVAALTLVGRDTVRVAHILGVVPVRCECGVEALRFGNGGAG